MLSSNLFHVAKDTDGAWLNCAGDIKLSSIVSTEGAPGILQGSLDDLTDWNSGGNEMKLSNPDSMTLSFALIPAIIRNSVALLRLQSRKT